MTRWNVAAVAACLTCTAVAQTCVPHRLVESEKLQKRVTLDGVLAHEEAFQEFAYGWSGANRVAGFPGHLASLEYIIEKLEGLGDYYSIETQDYSTWVETFNNGSLILNGELVPSATMQFSRNTTVKDVELIYVNSYGCNSSADFPAAVAGNIAILSRGPAGANPPCTFALKSANAGLAGAAGLIVFDNVPGADTLQGTLAAVDPPEGPTIPSIGISNPLGLSLAARLQSGEKITVTEFFTVSAFQLATGYNVIATSTRGDPDNVLMLGAHSDSVAEGPGINDNGSGSAALLEIALQLGRYLINNTVRFAWWTAEEEGLLGSWLYADTAAAEDLQKIRLYLNFDMIASGNGVLARYDGDGDTFGITGPPGSDVAEHMFEDYFASKDIPLTTSQFNGRSDYGPFLEYGVPCGGLDTGADEVKTEEEAAIWGGTAGIIMDPNYHGPGDTIGNMSLPFLEINAKAIAHAVATYAVSWDGFPERLPSAGKREVVRAPITTQGCNKLNTAFKACTFA